MAVSMVRYALEQSPARGSARLVLLALADRADDCGLCWPSIGDIARRAQLSRRQTQRAVARLIQMGELRILQPGGGRNKVNRVLVVAGRSAAELDRVIGKPCHARQGNDPKPGHPRPKKVTSAPQKGDICAQKPCHRCHPNHQRTREEPPEEPSQGATLLGRVASRNAGSAGAAAANTGRVILDIQQLLADSGVDDPALRNIVARWGDPRVVRRLAAEYDRTRDRIRNPGGWWRDRLRRAGVRGV